MILEIINRIIDFTQKSGGFYPSSNSFKSLVEKRLTSRHVDQIIEHGEIRILFTRMYDRYVDLMVLGNESSSLHNLVITLDEIKELIREKKYQ